MVLLAEFVFLAALLLGAVYVAMAGIRWASGRWHQRSLDREGWSTDIHPNENGFVAVLLVRTGESPVNVATLDPSGEDFEAALLDAEVRADNMAKAMNRAERRRR